ncbi:unnamed protein product [Meloidogyne enterolobii]|uniref:Uncharacterized protein n=1 Tax=Meloidogyne enterolobii TaxID=390850 RepID=A0ACB0ZKG9_MELEN
MVNNFKIFPFIISFILFFLISNSNSMRQQAIGAKGRLLCGSKPAANVLVKLYDKDTGKFLIFLVNRFYYNLLFHV